MQVRDLENSFSFPHEDLIRREAEHGEEQRVEASTLQRIYIL